MCCILAVGIFRGQAQVLELLDSTWNFLIPRVRQRPLGPKVRAEFWTRNPPQNNAACHGAAINNEVHFPLLAWRFRHLCAAKSCPDHSPALGPRLPSPTLFKGPCSERTTLSSLKHCTLLSRPPGLCPRPLLFPFLSCVMSTHPSV